LKDTEGFLEKRETITSLKRRSTGVYIKKDIGEPKTGEKKLLIKEFTEKKELDQGIKKGFLPKGEQNISENQLKKPLLKDSDKPILESKPILKLEKTKEPKDLIKQPEETTLSKQLTKQEIGKIESNLENTLEQLDILSSTSTINIQQKLTEQKIAEKLTEDKITDKVSDKIQEIEIKIETTDKTNVNIEAEIFENAITEIIKNLHKSDLVVFTMLKMVDNIYELSKDRLKLAFWITRILNITELLKLTKIKQKLIKILEELNYYKIASYINYSLNTKNTYTYLFEVLLENEFENTKNNIKEYFRSLIDEKLYFTFNEFYNKLVNKFKNEKDQIDDIIIDLFKETTEETEAYYLAAVLNAPLVDRLIKPTQARGLWGPRHIHKKVLDLPIPQFDPSQEDHRRLAELGKACSERVAAWLATGGPGKTQSIGRLRRLVREMLREELAEIDECTTQILGAETRGR